MAHPRTDASSRATWQVLRFATLFLGLLLHTPLFAFTLNVVDSNGTAITGGFRWVLEEDTSYRQPLGTWTGPTAPESDKANVLSFNFYKSYMPVRGSGSTDSATAEIAIPENGKRYFVSVLASDPNYQMSGRPVAPDAQGAYGPVTVVLNSGPVPTAQIFVIAHRDDNPINNVFDQAQETGIGGFTVKIDDTVDQVKQDAFGNMLGTVYRRNADGSPVLDGDGNPVVRCPGDGVIRTTTQADIDAANAGAFCRNPYNLAVGEALIKNLHPGKYGVKAVPPTGTAWQQTATIEGTKTIDAWVKGNEPPYFAEFGAGMWHASFGYVRPFNLLPTLPSTGTRRPITGRVVNMRMTRPPVYSFSPGHPLENCWVGLNESLLGGIPGRGLYAAPCTEGAEFRIPGVPPGTYQLVMFDKNLDNIFGFHTVEVGNSAVALGDVPVFRWFGALDHYVYYDSNGNGVRDVDAATGELEAGIPEQAVNLRYRDGSIYQSFPTDMDGYVPFEEVFPFFFWQVAEVDFLRYKATGLTVTVDAGGQVTDGLGQDKLNPQDQGGGALQRTETGPVLTQGFQSFLGTTNVFEWGKQPYAPGENGGISGIVHYATTRAENDPRLTGAEDWEPGIPRVQVNLYRDSNADGVIDDLNGNGQIDLPDINNYPFDDFPGPGDLDRNSNGTFDNGDALQVVTTDSWDDNLPDGCPGDAADPFYQNGKCYDGLRNYNQVRPALFDGGYAFNDIPAGTYIVEAITPSGYLHQKEEDKNVDFGDAYTPSPLLLPPVCVGDKRVVQANLSLFPGVPAPFAGESRPLCDRKQVLLSDRQNAAADFFMFTEVPVTGHIQGFVLNDLANEFDVNSPQFGEKQSMPFLPVSIRDWTGREVNRVYTDQYGSYNGLVPGSSTMNRPSPSGVSQSMHQICVNDPGPVPDPANPANRIIDPFFNRQYTQFCYTLNFLSGRVTFLDTPVLPIAAFANLGINPVDSAFPAGTPMIHSVDRANAAGTGQNLGPWVGNVAAQRFLRIVSVGTMQVANPAFTIEGNENGTNPQPATIARDFGFGAAQGTVRLGNTTLPIVSWSDGVIVAQVPAGVGTGQLSVMRGDNGLSTLVGVTVHVGVAAGQVRSVSPNGTYRTIQAAIDAAPANGLVLVPPGTYEEMVIMYKPVRLQGWGAGSTVINATLAPTEKTQLWRRKISELIAANQVTLLPGQADPLQDIEGFLGSEGAPIFVIGRQGGATSFATNRRAIIDGFTVSGSNGAGGIAVNSFANFLTVSNNRVLNNQGLYGGGIRLGQPLLDGAINNNVTIRNNQVCENGTLQTPGGGIAIYAGSTTYEVSNNWVCANFAQGDGGGIAHYGLSQNGRIVNNKILFNQTFEQTAGVGGAGGGIFIAGEPVAAGLTPGSGSVLVEGNLIQGNNAGTGDGAGIATTRVNGAEVNVNNATRTNPNRWHRLDIFDNIIVNNVTGLAGGGIALHDTLNARVLQNSIADNDSTATAAAAFGGCADASPNQSCPQPAGVISRANSPALETVLNTVPNRFNRGRFYSRFSDPLFDNNIVWQNRSFYYSQTATPTNPPVPGSQLIGQLLPDPASPVFNDLAVLGVAGQLNPRFSVLTSTAGYDPSNVSDDPGFVSAYFNGDRGQSIIQPEFTTSLTVRAALDEGGNYIDVRYGPLALTGNYHLNSGSAAAELGTPVYTSAGASYIAELTTDFDVATRPICARPDAGADEVAGACLAQASGNNAATTTVNAPVTFSVNSLSVRAHSVGCQSAVAVAVRTPTASGATVAMSDDRTAMTYVPATNWSGTDTVVVVVDDCGAMRTATAGVTVAPGPATDSVIPDAAVASSPAGANDAGAAGTTGGASSIADSEVAAAPAGSGGMLAYVPAAGETSIAKASPADGTSRMPANEAPAANDDELVVSEFDAQKGYYVFSGFDILDNDTDVDGDQIKSVLVDDAKEGHVKLASDGTFTYTPPKGALPKGPIRFTYRVSDGKKTSDVATVTFTIDSSGGTAKPAATKSEPPRDGNKADRSAPGKGAAAQTSKATLP